MHLVRVPTIIIIQWKGILITYNFLLMDWFGLHSICSVGLKTAFYFRDDDFDNCSLIKYLNSLKFAHNFVSFESFKCTSLDSFHLSILKIRSFVTALLSLRYEIFAGCVEFLVECIYCCCNTLILVYGGFNFRSNLRDFFTTSLRSSFMKPFQRYLKECLQ